MLWLPSVKPAGTTCRLDGTMLLRVKFKAGDPHLISVLTMVNIPGLVPKFGQVYRGCNENANLKIESQTQFTDAPGTLWLHLGY
jgi:hypothetical protein